MNVRLWLGPEERAPQSDFRYKLRNRPVGGDVGYSDTKSNAMSLISIFLLALALAADSFAASIAKGTKLYRPTIWQALFVAVLFSGVQVLMPLVGWQIGIELQPII